MSVVMEAIATMMNSLLCLMLTLGFLYSTTVYANCDYDDFPLMPDMRVQTVMDNVIYNDRPMMVRNFNIEASAEQVVGYYRQQWRNATVDSQLGAWRQISTLTKKCLMTVQYAEMPGTGTFGRLVISNVPQLKPGAELGRDLRLPSGTFVVSDMKTEDGPKKGRVTLLTSDSSVDQLVSYYRSNMQADGWALENNFREGNHAVMVFRKRLNESNIIITQAPDATQILINQVEVH
jgi:hypothetical protein